MVLAGLGLFTGNIVARTIAVIVASLSLIANFLFIPAYPVWALTVIALDVLGITPSWPTVARSSTCAWSDPELRRRLADGDPRVGRSM